jgi:hypothetical protein
VNKRDLRRAAAILRREARAIKASHQFGRSQWFAGPFATALYREVVARDRRYHDEMLDLARKLVAHAKECA